MTGVSFNNAYRYREWLLAVPLSLVEILLVMKATRIHRIGEDEVSFELRHQELGNWKECGRADSLQASTRS